MSKLEDLIIRIIENFETLRNKKFVKIHIRILLISFRQRINTSLLSVYIPKYDIERHYVRFNLFLNN